MRKELGWDEYNVIQLSWALLLLAVILSTVFIPERYLIISVILIVLSVFMRFVMGIIDRVKIKLVFPEKKKNIDSMPQPIWGDNYSHPSPFSSNPNEHFQNLFDLLINERILYPYLDIALLIMGFLIAVILLLISIYNLVLILAMVFLYYILLDKLTKNYEKKLATR